MLMRHARQSTLTSPPTAPTQLQPASLTHKPVELARDAVELRVACQHPQRHCPLELSLHCCRRCRGAPAFAILAPAAAVQEGRHQPGNKLMAVGAKVHGAGSAVGGQPQQCLDVRHRLHRCVPGGWQRHVRPGWRPKTLRQHAVYKSLGKKAKQQGGQSRQQGECSPEA